MPNRIIKESISKSEKISQLTDFQFRLWIHLMIYVDDFGRGDARPAVIRGTCFPFRERLANKDIEKGIADLAAAGCVSLYTVDGKPYLQFLNWDKHQRVRQKVSKCPEPEEKPTSPQYAATCGELPQPAAGCCNMPQHAARIQNTESRIQNTESESRRDNAREDFDRFWSAYPRKAGNKQKTFDIFRKIDVPVDTLLEAIEVQKQSAQWTKDNGQFIPYPATWLNGRRWEDQIPVSDSIPKGASGILGAAEEEAIRRVLAEELSDLPYNF